MKEGLEIELTEEKAQNQLNYIQRKLEEIRETIMGSLLV
jgi:hypothetical protein